MAPGMLDLGEAVFDLMRAADSVKDVLEGINVPMMICELDAAAIGLEVAIVASLVRATMATAHQ